jgi:hypothetical protein
VPLRFLVSLSILSLSLFPRSVCVLPSLALRLNKCAEDEAQEVQKLSRSADEFGAVGAGAAAEADGEADFLQTVRTRRRSRTTRNFDIDSIVIPPDMTVTTITLPPKQDIYTPIWREVQPPEPEPAAAPAPSPPPGTPPSAAEPPAASSVCSTLLNSNMQET